ncbi:hypothetical protein KSU1_C0972 [Candidatus Jettenia caeni]|uniref:Uncharacterized protein n=1 Tax=Candidatus Jettenia caeni TaxID=247490 RepID=I3ILH3_9BACT|nr:hypothetical protein [Candidatus Jettenia sp. AMX1]MCQ3925838.1 hypothetical protein [Candidatus Jettenia sp.]GAB62568.1 hypothetical protein KSU1_C0972 [Candidatus Jettenia caeni]KAA0251783.1 MAG: hypothetical protein EDM77_00380 [Candidatus Jettenia sp. AMX1]MCE7879092.1 hypothetical protein [Candidatus Jettenia sp. AMX1]MDL1937500.1 hypothetical protein [Candidatus Jettenia sp. AMX1]
MSEESVITLNDKKLYLATFEFICGEYGQVFEKAFYAKDEETLEKKIHKYLFNCYGKGNMSEINRNVYYYWNGEVAVKNHGWEEITGIEQLVDKLLQL